MSLGICECVYERMSEYIFVKWLMMVYGCDETNGSWFCFIFFSECGGSQLSLLSVYLFPCECVSLYCLKAFLYTIRYFYCMVYVCLLCEWTCKTRSRLFYSFLLKGCLDFGFIYLKNLFLSFSLLTIIYCFYFITRTSIKHTLSALRTLNTIVYYPNDRRATNSTTAFSECNV